MKMFLLVSSIAAGAISSPALAQSQACQTVTEPQVAALFDRWNSSLKTGKPKAVVANYAEKSVLLPTVSNIPRLTADAKEDYFAHFVESGPVGEINSRVIELGCNTAIDSGLYTFSFKDGSSVKARYTFTYRWDGKQWLISSHHSSAMPEG
jgi:uncharacterized protein (TIGR02246 family)